MDCLGFVVLVRKLMNDQRSIPRFFWQKEELGSYLIPYDQLDVGDLVLFRRKKILDERRKTRFFTHLALKYDDDRVAHMTRQGSALEDIQSIQAARILLNVPMPTHPAMRGATHPL